jgi:hypothetical protein
MEGAVSPKRDLRAAIKSYITDVILSGTKPSAYELKEGFKAANPATVDSHAAQLVDEALLKIIGEVLRGLVSLDGDKHQLSLPFDLADLDLDGVISFADSKGTIRWSGIAQTTAAEIQSHLAILAEQVAAVTAKYDDLKTLWNRVRHLMLAHTEMTLSEALAMLAA